MVNVGLVTGPSKPRAREAPRTNVVFPAPSSPSSSTTSPACSVAASAAPAASVAAALVVVIVLSLEALRGVAQGQADADEHQHDAGEHEDARVQAGTGQLAGRRR